MFATITKKQAGVIFAAWKREELRATDGAINMMYGRFVGNSAPTTDAIAIECAAKLRNVIDAIFAKDGSATDKFAEFVDYYKAHYEDSIYAL